MFTPLRNFNIVQMTLMLLWRETYLFWFKLLLYLIQDYNIFIFSVGKFPKLQENFYKNNENNIR